MIPRRPHLRPPLPALGMTLSAGLIFAACGDDGGTEPVQVASVTVTPPSVTLEQVDETQQFTAEAFTDDGDPVAEVTVAWSSTDPSVATVDAATGVATAVQDGTTRIVAEVDGVEGDADVLVELIGLQVSSPVVANGRVDLPYEGAVAIKGGIGPYTVEVTQGTLPAGLAMQDDGSVVGTPTAVETVEFTVQVTDASAETVTRMLSLTVCDEPTPFQVGESVALAPPARGDCGVFMPAGAGHRYRVALVRTSTSEGAAVRELMLRLRAYDPGSTVNAPAAPAPQTDSRPPRPPLQVAPEALTWSREVAEATRAHHEELRRAEESMIRWIGTDGLLPDLRPPPGLAAARQAAQQLPEKLSIDPTTPTSCSPAGTPATALKIAENDHLAVFQDSTQNANAGQRVTAEEAQALLDFHADFAKPVVDDYFGGVPDIDQNGKVVLLVTPAVGGNTAAFVWSGDFFDVEQCPASNEMEIVFFNQSIVAALDDPTTAAQGLETLAHEMKHVSSLYERVQRSNSLGQAAFHPTWWEEGVAEVAGGVAARFAWAADGGPAVTDMLDEQDWRDALGSGEALTDNAQFGVLLRLFRAQEYLASQPNGLSETPPGAREGHSVYGSGWVFSRWLGDAFGEAATAPFAEADFWATMNDQEWPSGIPGIEQALGMGWNEVLERYTLALMLHGTEASAPPETFTTYDLVSAIELWCFAADNPPCDGVAPGPAGLFPWPVTTASDGTHARSFQSAEYEGSSGAGGVRIFEFVSDGTGAGTELHADVPGQTRMVVVRIN